jgi:NADH-quinone oxidoreductase subunit E
MPLKLEPIDEILKHYSNDKSNLIQILLTIQEKERYLSHENFKLISLKLNIPLTKIYQVAEFYNAFSFKPQGRHKISVCMGTACHVRGAPMILERLTQKLEINTGCTTDDNRFTLVTANCLGCCALGPVISIDDQYFSNPSNLELEKILKKFE